MLYTKPKYKAKRLEYSKAKSITIRFGIIPCNTLIAKVDIIKALSRLILLIKFRDKFLIFFLLI